MTDKRHPKWLHLRIRASTFPSNSQGGTFPFFIQNPRNKSKKLADGRWTLAFPSEEKSRKAEISVLEEMCVQSNAVRQVLEPVLGQIQAFKLDDNKTTASHEDKSTTTTTNKQTS